jgi:hypothetical protein
MMRVQVKTLYINYSVIGYGVSLCLIEWQEQRRVPDSSKLATSQVCMLLQARPTLDGADGA